MHHLMKTALNGNHTKFEKVFIIGLNDVRNVCKLGLHTVIG